MSAYLSVAEVAEVIGCNPQSLREQIKEDPTSLGFPVCRIGKRIRIPKVPFEEFTFNKKGEAQ